MNEISVLICDRDECYVDALVQFLLGSKREYVVHSYTRIDEFLEDRGKYNLGLLTADFLQEIEMDTLKSKVRTIIQITDGLEEAVDDVEQLYKYQAMDKFLMKMERATADIRCTKASGEKELRFLSVYSPIHHELTLPFSIMLSRLMEAEGNVLLIDMEENSIINELTGQSAVIKNILDYMYMIESGGEGNIYDYLQYYEGFSYLPPARNPTEISRVSAHQWKHFMDEIASSDFQVVVLLFDNIHTGFEEMVSRSEELVLINRPGDYYRKFERNILKFLKLSGLPTDIREIALPMSAVNLNDGSYQMEELYQGNLGNFIRKTFEVGLAYGA